MIYIEPGDSVILPKKYHYQHNVCVRLHDLMVELLKSKEFEALHGTAIAPPRQGDIGAITPESGGEEILNFLKVNNRRDEAVRFLSKHILTHVLGDFCHFIHESLRCACAGKMSVSYTLLRKPVTDELLIFEQLLTEREDFIDRFFYQGEPNLYDPSAGNHGEAGLKLIISAATARLGTLTPLFGDVMYEFRYDKSQPGSLNAMMNHAHHIVTNDRRYRTAPQSLNFVFSIKEDYQRYWNAYYSLVPFLLLYATAVVDRLVSELIEFDSYSFARREMERFLGLIFYMEKGGGSQQRKASKPVFKQLAKLFTVKCRCGHHNTLERADFKLLYDGGVLLCVKCTSQIHHYKEFQQKMADFFNGGVAPLTEDAGTSTTP